MLVLLMADKALENNINLDVSVSEQIADMQLMYLRQAALNRVLSFDEIKTLEILSIVKNNEEERRQPKEESADQKRTKKMKELVQTAPLNLVEQAPKEEVKDNGPEETDPAKCKRTS